MKNNHTFKTLMLAAVSAVALASFVHADDTALGVADDTASLGNYSLLGTTHGTLTYSRINLDGTTVDADNYALEVNQSVADGFDAVLGYSYSRSGDFGPGHVSQHVLAGALRAFSTSFSWGKPYVEAGLGHVWSRFAGNRDKSLLWEAATGVEFQVAPRATVTPYVQYVDTPDLAGSQGAWNFGVKGSYWVDQRWAVTAGIEQDDEQNTAFTVGTNFRY